MLEEDVVLLAERTQQTIVVTRLSFTESKLIALGSNTQLAASAETKVNLFYCWHVAGEPFPAFDQH